MLINYNKEFVYYIIKAGSYCYNEINHIEDFIHLAAFWKILDELSVNDIYVNLVNYKLNMTCFFEECMNCMEEYTHIHIHDNMLLQKISKYITVNNDLPCEEICEPSFDGLQIHDIIYELLDRIMFNDCEFIDDAANLYETIQYLKRINREIYIE